MSAKITEYKLKNIPSDVWGKVKAEATEERTTINNLIIGVLSERYERKIQPKRPENLGPDPDSKFSGAELPWDDLDIGE